MVITFAGYIIAYHTYGRFLGRKIFKLDNSHTVPSESKEDGVDFVPTKKSILFGHHFASIAGTGPIVGPAIGIIWGWVPAMLWIFFGSILMGAIHDFGALVISLRNQGLSLSECATKYLGKRVRYIFFLIIFLELLIIIAIFGLVIALIFARFPHSVIPVWLQIPIAVILGLKIYKPGGNLIFNTGVAVLCMYTTIVLGNFIPVHIPAIAGIPATGIWTILLLTYAFIASTLPVTTLLQPRDYINAWQLTITMALLMLGVLVSGLSGQLTMVAPAVNLHPEGAPPIWPFLFITIACGAVSGFHSLVSSGTSSKQLARESDALFVGYGSMLMEAALATLVIIAVGAGIGMSYGLEDGSILTGTAAWQQHYASWQASSGLGAKLDAMVIGSANMMTSFGIPQTLAVIIMGVFVASFAGTTMDSATRIQRYIISELFIDVKNIVPTEKYNWVRNMFDVLSRPYPATLIVVVTAGVLAFASGANGNGALKLWPMFGGVNQLLAALGLLLIANYLKRKGGRQWLLAGIPCGFMLIATIWSVSVNEAHYIKTSHWLLAVINGTTLLLALWMILESLVAFRARPSRAS